MVIMKATDFVQRMRYFFSGISNSEPGKKHTLQNTFEKFSSSADFLSEKVIVERIKSSIPRFDSFIETFLKEKKSKGNPVSPSLIWNTCFAKAEDVIPEIKRWNTDISDKEISTFIGTWAELLYAIVLHNLKREKVKITIFCREDRNPEPQTYQCT